MKICVAQTKAVKGDIHANIENHKKLITLAAEKSADLIIFPELSITGYEPELAKELATNKDDQRFKVFQNLSDKHSIQIGIGMPLTYNGAVSISMILFEPGIDCKTYSKQYLHADELPYFIEAENQSTIINQENKIAMAICYEISISDHIEKALQQQAKIYISSVAKTFEGVDNAIKTLAKIASENSMLVLLSNYVGHCDNFDCGGKSSAWNDQGELLAQLDSFNEGILIVDTNNNSVFNSQLSYAIQNS